MIKVTAKILLGWVVFITAPVGLLYVAYFIGEKL